MKDLIFEHFKTPHNKDVLACYVTEELAAMVRTWPGFPSTVYEGDFLVITRGKMLVVAEAVFVQYYVKVEQLSERDIQKSRLWFVHVEFPGRRDEILKHYASRYKNTREDVTKHFTDQGARVISANQ